MRLEFNWNYKYYTIRAVPKCLVRFEESDINETIELIKWYHDKEDGSLHCDTLAYWATDEEGYYLKFVGDRPFERIDSLELEAIWRKLKQAQKVLDEFWLSGESQQLIK